MLKKSLVVLLIAFTFSANAQVLKEFTKEKEAYYNQLVDLFTPTNSDIIEDFLEKRFKPVWNQLGGDDAQFVYEISDAFLKKRLKPVPHYRDFLGTIINFKAGKGSGNYPDYKIALRKLAADRNKVPLENYLETLYGMLEYGELSKSNTITWTFQPQEFSLNNDSAPSVVLNDVTLTGKTKAETGNIYNVTAILNTTTGFLEATQGIVNWERASLSKTTNYAQLNKFSVKLASNFYVADSAEMRCEFYPKPMKGKVNERILTASNSSGLIDYPLFESYDNDIKIENIIENVDYFGGFSLKGQRFSGQGSSTSPSKMVFKQNGKAFLEAYATTFGFEENAIAASSARIVIKLGKDSIAHSNVRLRYDKTKKKAELMRDDRMGINGPFSSSYHQIDFYPEVMSWTNGDTALYFGPLKGNAETKAIFESNNFFIKERFKALQFGTGLNPVEQVANYPGNQFYIKDFAQFNRTDIPNAKQLLLDLANKGFLFYDIDKQMVTVKDKLYDFLEAYNKQRDYDDMVFSSVVPDNGVPNAILNLNTYDLNILGVKSISLSDSQSVAIYTTPKSPMITMRKNRDIHFGGVLKAGGFDFYGSDFNFSYDSFKVDLIKVDSCALYITRTLPNGDKQFVPIQTKINDITGVLLIDKIDNKSGLDTARNKEFPILKTNENSFAYYDKPETYNSVYDRKKVFFQIDPFDLDSLDNFNQDVLNFKGQLVTSGIFPIITDSLRIQEDFSLGFKHKTPKTGLPLYSTVAIFKNEIQLSDKGLVGDGDIEYLSSISSAPRFVFFPDSTTAVAKSINNKKQLAGPNVPDFVNSDFHFAMYAKANELALASIKDDFVMFNKEAKQKGKLLLKPAGLFGSGELRMFDGKLTSNQFKYNNSNALADTATFDLNTFDNSGIALSTDQISAQIDFNYRVGTFKALAPDAKVSFPKNQYVAIMDTYKWIIDEKEVELSSSLADGETNSRFFSTHPKQDSLNFKVPKAVYNIKTYSISCKEVEQILVADALIQPNNGGVTIQANAVIDTLKEATIIADVDNRFHTIFNANVNIQGAKSYIGNGNYNYEDDKGVKQKIAFANIAVDSSLHTFAKGQIPEEQKFKLNAYFDYRGSVLLNAKNKGLSFEGATRILTNCDRIERNWLLFKAQVDPKDVIIPVNQDMTNDLGEKLAAGIIMNTSDEAFVYPTFISKKVNPSDPQITEAGGSLWYNADDKSYNIGAIERHDKTGKGGNLISLNTNTCDITYNGAMSFGADYGQVKVKLIGNAKYDYKQSSTNLNGYLSLNFFFEKKMLDQMASKAAAYPFLQPVNITSTQFDKALLDVLGPKKAKEINEEMAKKGSLDKIPSGMQTTFAFADVKFKWNDKTATFVSVGDLGLASINEKPIFTYLKGKLEFSRLRTGNELGMYLEYTPEMWYFFKYKIDDRPRMQFNSIDADFMKMVGELKPKDLKMNTPKGEPAYEFEQGSRSSKVAFLEKFE